MIYAINRWTKEHRITEPGKVYENLVWRCVESDADGWIPWKGGECPLPDGEGVQVKTNIGIENAGRADEFRWARQSRHGDIIAYRPILDAPGVPIPAEQTVRVVQCRCASSPVAVPEAPRCKYCDGTGDVHSPDGEWRGECTVCKPDAMEWDGEGLPPVGCECREIGIGETVRIIAHIEVPSHGGKSAASVYQSIENVDVVGWSFPHAFEPLHSEEDRFVDQVNEVMKSEGLYDLDRHARALYRAGFRKEPT